MLRSICSHNNEGIGASYALKLQYIQEGAFGVYSDLTNDPGIIQTFEKLSALWWNATWKEMATPDIINMVTPGTEREASCHIFLRSS